MITSDEILAYWFGDVLEDVGAIPGERLKFWFSGGEEVDREIRARYSGLLEQTARGAFDHWRKTPEGTLALILVLDQFSRNIHRGTSAAFAADHKALQVCLEGLSRQDDQSLPLVGRAFFYLPLEHSEDPAMQQRSVAAFEALARLAPECQQKTFLSFLDYAERHQEIIDRFGRYPHRNQALGRSSTAEEVAFLKQPGSSF